MKFQLGDKVRDTVSGFTGTITARCDYLHDKPSYAIVGQAKEIASDVDPKWMTEDRLVLVSKRKAK